MDFTPNRETPAHLFDPYVLGKTTWNTDQERFASVVKKIRNPLSRRNQKKDLLLGKIEDTAKKRNLIEIY
jgi:hypothetical protein